MMPGGTALAESCGACRRCRMVGEFTSNRFKSDGGLVMSTVSERERFDFEREKWRDETVMRTREVSVKERDGAVSKWRSPLVVAVLAAAAAALGNGIVAVVNGVQQVRLENS